MPRPDRPWAAAAAGFVYRRWHLTFCLVCLSALLHVIFLRDKFDYLPNFSLTNMATDNTSGESPGNQGATCRTCYLGQERCWAGLCKDLLKARKEANDYFDSQVLMRVLHRLPMDNETLYGELHSLRSDTLYRFRNQIGIKDVTGHFWDDLEVDMGETILSLLQLNQMVAKENNEEDEHGASFKLESDCGNMTVSHIKVVCLENQIAKNAKESRRREYIEGERRLLERERTRRVNSRAERIYHQFIQTENKLKQEREAFKHDKEIFEKSVKELEQRKQEEEKRRMLERERTRRLNGLARRSCDRLLFKTNDPKLEQERKAHRPQQMMKLDSKHIAISAFRVVRCVAIFPVVILCILILYVTLVPLTRTSHEQNNRRRSLSSSFQFAIADSLLIHGRQLTANDGVLKWYEME